MKRIPQGSYSKEFREEAVKLVIDQELSIPGASRRLDIPKSTISNWGKAKKAGKLALCNQMDLSESGYYAWRSRPRSRHQQDDTKLKVIVKAAHKRTRETCGPERLQRDIIENEGVQVSVHRIKRLRKELGIRCRRKKKFKATTNSNNSLPVAPNLVDQNFTATAPNQIWLTDITYIRTGEGWLYLAAHKDIFHGEVVGYALGKRMTKALVMKSLFRAVAKKHPPAGLIHHSDRGSQYCPHRYMKMLKQFEMKASMSRRGNCYDNAPITHLFP
ncbi:IS3 family transposase [Desulfopila inferna]|nr:IS3 family transposase [Desulfopila inferna]